MTAISSWLARCKERRIGKIEKREEVEKYLRESAFVRFKEYVGNKGLDLADIDEHAFKVEFVKDNLSYSLLVAHGVLEWFLDIEDVDNKNKHHDWCDYVGYGEKDKKVLARNMEEDLTKFVTYLLSEKFRLNEIKSGLRLEVFIDGQWADSEEHFW